MACGDLGADAFDLLRPGPGCAPRRGRGMAGGGVLRGRGEGLALCLARAHGVLLRLQRLAGLKDAFGLEQGQLRHGDAGR